MVLLLLAVVRHCWHHLQVFLGMLLVLLMFPAVAVSAVAVAKLS